MSSFYGAPYLQDYARHQRRAKLNSLCGGLLFGFGWLVFIDAAVWSGFFAKPEGLDIVCTNGFPLFVASLFLFALNLMDIDDVRTARYEHRLGGRVGWSLFWLLFCGVIGTIAVLSSIFLVVKSTSQTTQHLGDSWLAGTAVCGCLFICVGAIVFWVGKGHEVAPL
mmetsp:Transcript_61289/g.144239  ORF Transcript_61289/g.144239 Transcript_61289/m.144239 type:complete len:166 (+) Transcript_61289:168-665(+)